MRWLIRSTPLAIALLSACATEPLGTAKDSGALDAKAGGSRIVYRVTIEGDFTLPSDSREVLVTRSASDPFGNTSIILEDVRFRIGAVDPTTGQTLGPSQDPVCTTSYPNMFARNGNLWPDHWNGNDGEWQGSANFSASGHILNLRGFRTVNGVAEEVQSSASTPGMVKAKSPEGVWSLTFTNALQYFGGNSTRHDDKHRCVSFFRIVLTPV